MSLFGSLMGDVEDDPFFGSHMRHMRQMNNMMNSMFSDPFGMLGGGPLAIAGPRHGSSLMPFMPPMPSLNRLFTADLTGGPMNAGTSFSSSTVVMSSGHNGKPQVYSSTSSTKIGPNGIKETRKTLQDSRTGTKKMSIGHHIGERAHLIEREQNVYSGDSEERQEFINLDEDEAEDFDREFQASASRASRRALPPALPPAAQLALPAPPAAPSAGWGGAVGSSRAGGPTGLQASAPRAPAPQAPAPQAPAPQASAPRPSARRPLRTTASPLTHHSASVREVYGGSHPQRHRHKHSKPTHRHSPADN